MVWYVTDIKLFWILSHSCIQRVNVHTVRVHTTYTTLVTSSYASTSTLDVYTQHHTGQWTIHTTYTTLVTSSNESTSTLDVYIQHHTGHWTIHTTYTTLVISMVYSQLIQMANLTWLHNRKLNPNPNSNSCINPNPNPCEGVDCYPYNAFFILDSHANSTAKHLTLQLQTNKEITSHPYKSSGITQTTHYQFSYFSESRCDPDVRQVCVFWHCAIICHSHLSSALW